MRTIQFSHANGFPAKTYSYILNQLQGEVHFVPSMGHGTIAFNGDFNNLTDELLNFITGFTSEPVTGIGHSSGAVVTLFAALKRPDLFDKIIVIEPVIFSARKRFPIWFFRKAGFGDLPGPTRKAINRRVQFKNRQEAADYFRTKSLFRNFDQHCFDDYINFGLKENKQGVELTFSAEVEADIFRNVPVILPSALRKLKGFMIYGQDSDLYWPSDLKWWRKNMPGFELIKVPGGHMFPMEHPESTADLINKLI